MAHPHGKREIGAALAASVLLAGAAQAVEDGIEAAARAAISARCERCHPPLPGGGWSVMTRRTHAPAELDFLLHRMAEEYAAFPTPAERAAIIAFLGRAE